MATLNYYNFSQTLKRFIELMTYQQRMSLWLDGALPSYTYLMGELSSYQLIGEAEVSSLTMPFMQKVLVPQGSKIILIGDLHGDIDAFDAIFKQLKKLAYCDEAGRFLSADCYLVFLGDYGNRKPGGIELITRLCELFIDNPGQVFLVRGNHEFAISNRFFRQRHRERNEAHLGITTFLDELEEAFPGYTYPDLLYWYDYLPVFVTLGSVDKKGKKRFLGCSHAGLELGWSAARFLENDALSFAYPTIIDRSLILADLEKIYGNDFLVEYNQMVALLVQDESSHRFLALYKEPERLFLAQKQLSPFEYRLGWIWNNLIAEDNKQQFIAASGSRRALFLGQELINYLFKKYSTDNAELIALVRGHQHFNEELPELGLKNNYLELIRDNKGLIRQWGGRAYTLGATTTVSHCYSFLTVTPQQDSSWGAVAWHKELLSDSWQERVYSLRDA